MTAAKKVSAASGATQDAIATASAIGAVKIVTPSIAAGQLTIDHSLGGVMLVTMTENITTITHTNVRPSGRDSIILQLVGNGTAYTVNWSGNSISFDGAEPAIPSVLDDLLEVELVTQNGGASYRGYVLWNDAG